MAWQCQNCHVIFLIFRFVIVSPQAYIFLIIPCHPHQAGGKNIRGDPVSARRRRFDVTAVYDCAGLTAPYTPTLSVPNAGAPPYRKSTPGTLRVRWRRFGGFLPTHSRSNSRSFCISLHCIVGSNPSASRRRVRTYFCLPSVWLRVKTSAPVSFAWRMAGLTNGWCMASPAVTMSCSDMIVSYGAGGSSSSSKSRFVHSGSRYRNLHVIQNVAIVPPASTAHQYTYSTTILQLPGLMSEKLWTAPRYA
mmetsp:Transcript_4316/g.12354  ORF Transcript_4316/g.12354 Transcript_4316/m.12354 type:complete len:248 (+) Transcript_4316:196-939(+)